MPLRAASPQHSLRCLLSLAAGLLMACAPGTSPVSRPASHSTASGTLPLHVVLVTIDGLVPDTYLQPDAHGLAIPTLRRFVAEGAYARGARSVFPSVTYPAHASIATGVQPARHGIFSNRSFDPLERDAESWRWYAEELRATPLWEVARRAGHKTALIGWPVTVGAQADFLIPEFWRTHTADDLKIVRALSTPGLLDAIERHTPGFQKRAFVSDAGDEAGVDAATYLLSTSKPRLLMLHVFQVDSAQHKQGLWSAPAISAIENADRQLGRLLDAIEQAGLGAHTRVVVASDHGFQNVTRQLHPRALLREAGLLTVDEKGSIRDWRAHALSSGGQAYVYLRDPADLALQQSVRALFAQRAAKPGSGIARVRERAEIQAAGGDPGAFLSLDAAEGTYFGWGLAAYETSASTRATHGFDPERADMQASLLMRGAGIRPGPLEEARLIDIAPTIAHWLGVALPDVDGRVLQ